MAGNANFPTSLDDNSSLYDVSDGVSTLQAAHHNNMKEAIKALESKVGIDMTDAPTSLDWRLGNATGGHKHSGASGQGAPINPTTIPHPSGGSLADYLGNAATYNAERFAVGMYLKGSAAVGSNLTMPVAVGRTAQIENISGVLRRGPSGATSSFIIRVGPTAVFGASVGLAMRFAPGATRYGQPSPNLTTYPSGAIITLDADAVGSSDPGQDLSVIFIFRV
jgi:hypothetical protein